MKLTTQLLLVPRFRMSRAVPLLPLHAFVAWLYYDYKFGILPKCICSFSVYVFDTIHI